MRNTSQSPILRDGYDLPVLGLDEGYFYELHIPTIVCISASFVCAAISIIVSFRRHHGQPFFSWTKCDRLIVYLAVCDGMFNLSHGSDHMIVVIIRDHVRPRALCELFGFVTTIFCMAQNLVVGIIAINIFMMICLHKNLNFGRRDWIIFLGTFGMPFLVAVVAWSLGLLGPNGFVCVTDGVKGWTAFVIIYTVPLIIIVVMNVTLYTLTWLKMSSEIRQLQKHLGQNPPSRRAALRAAKNMSLFVAAFLVQWSLVGIYGAWEIFTEVPVIMLHLATKFSNIGGVLNLCVFIVVHRNNYRKQQPQVKSKTQNTKSNDITETE